MPPRLHHTKSKSGCQHCKARKVKCDEVRPRCTACARHDITCEYPLVSPERRPSQQSSSHSEPRNVSLPGPIFEDENPLQHGPDPMLELRLMHEWTAHTSETFSPAIDYWRYQATLVALRYRYALDALLALTALHLSRQRPNPSMSVGGRRVSIKNPIYLPSHPRRQLFGQWKELPDDWQVEDTDDSTTSTAVRRKFDMLTVSRTYFDRAVEGHRKALASLSVENMEAAFLTSVLVSFCALFSLSESEEDAVLPTLDPIRWLHLARGVHYIGRRWRELAGKSYMISSGIFYGSPDLTDGSELFDREHCRPFGRLLTWAQDYEVMSDEDRDTYQRALSYVGLIYKGIKDDTDNPLHTCRRFIAMPPRCPPGFVDLVEANQSRALTIMAHFFAIMKMVEEQIPWVKGIAEKQVPKIYERLPVGWRQMMAWPMAVTQGELNREPVETFVEDLLSS